MYCCLAVGFQNQLLVYKANDQHPLVVLDVGFNGRWFDLSWSPDRHVLLACSEDGTITCMSFNDEELGVISRDKYRFQRMYCSEMNISSCLILFHLFDYSQRFIIINHS